MFFENKKSRFFCLGYDICEEYSQISYFASNADKPDTLSVVTGVEQYNIPTVLAKKKGESIWYFGKEAVSRIESGDAISAGNLIANARKKIPLQIENTVYDPIALLALFIRRSLSLLSMEAPLEHVSRIVFTSRVLDEDMIGILNQVKQSLNFQSATIMYQSYEESLYYFMLNQPRDLWLKDAFVADYSFGKIWMYRLKLNRRTKPVVATIDKIEIDDLALAKKELPTDTRKLEMLDEQLLYYLKKNLDKSITSSVFLLGEAFKNTQWLQRTLKYLCNGGRRVFQGNNLFSKGASIAAMEQERPSEFMKNFVLLGEDKVRFNVGMKLLKTGQLVYYALVDAGVSWFDVGKTFSVILENVGTIDEPSLLAMEVIPVTGGKPHFMYMPLDGLVSRKRRMTRLLIQLDMINRNVLRVHVTDQGFGEFVPSSQKEWIREMTLTNSFNDECKEGVISNLLLCAGRESNNGITLRKFDIRLHSIEELCYLIENNAFMIEAEDFSDDLLEWIENGCLLEPLASELRFLKNNKASSKKLVMTVIDYVKYNYPEKIADILSAQESSENMDYYDRKILRAKFMVDAGFLANAFELYTEVEKSLPDTAISKLCRVYHNQAVILAKLFYFDSAAELFLKEYKLGHNENAFISFLCAKRLELSDKEYVDFVSEDHERFTYSMEVERIMKKVLGNYENSNEKQELDKISNSYNEGNNQIYEEKIQKVLSDVKEKYRLMFRN